MAHRFDTTDEPLTGEPDTRPSTGRRRIYATATIVLFLLFQLLVPLRYYLSGDPFDERFAWRMFSAVRVTRCQAMASERTSTQTVAHPVRLSGGRDRTRQPHYGVVHSAWTTLIRRNRVAVIEAYLEHRCQVAELAEASIVNQCADLAGRPLPRLRWHRRCGEGETAGPTAAELAAVRRGGRPEAR